MQSKVFKRNKLPDGRRVVAVVFSEASAKPAEHARREAAQEAESSSLIEEITAARPPRDEEAKAGKNAN